MIDEDSTTGPYKAGDNLYYLYKAGDNLYYHAMGGRWYRVDDHPATGDPFMMKEVAAPVGAHRVSDNIGSCVRFDDRVRELEYLERARSFCAVVEESGSVAPVIWIRVSGSEVMLSECTCNEEELDRGGDICQPHMTYWRELRSFEEAERAAAKQAHLDMLRAIMDRFAEDAGKRWQGCEFGKAVIGNAILRAIEEAGGDRRQEIETRVWPRSFTAQE